MVSLIMIVGETVMKYCENSLNYEKYTSLRTSVGWHNFSKEQAIAALNHSAYDVTVIEDDETIAMGRLIGDGVYYMIVDVIVHPQFQGIGIGSKIMEMLLDYVDNNVPLGGRTSVQLISEKGKEEFYIKKGFKMIPHEFCGSGMRKVIKK